MNLDWMLPASAFAWINQNVPKGSTILELGSGYGSRVLAESYELFSIEHDRDWVGRFGSVLYIYAPIVDNWYCPKTILEQAPEFYDLLIIDGPPGVIGRLGLLDHLNLFAWGPTPVLIDDLHRKSERDMADALQAELGLHEVHKGGDGRRSWGVFSR